MNFQSFTAAVPSIPILLYIYKYEPLGILDMIYLYVAFYVDVCIVHKCTHCTISFRAICNAMYASVYLVMDFKVSEIHFNHKTMQNMR